ncbi:TPA: hypothetical protein EYP66_07095 [Candidatus Poribacteria bacterium]|nr:hypothetical protein [Candidatus Poribacteria bacterium]
MLLSPKEVDIVLVEFKDRLARFGYTYLVEFCSSHGVSIEVVTQQEVKKDATQELVEDMLAIVTSFSARLYGQRSQQFKKKVKELIDKEEKSGKSNQNDKSQN